MGLARKLDSSHFRSRISTRTMHPPSEGLGTTEVEAYVARLGLPAASIGDPDRSTLTRLQRAHVTTIPFETLSITGDPHGKRTGEAIGLSPMHLHEKIVERGRGGYCFELNGLFHELLAALGYDVYRVAARVVSGGAIRTPANHQAILVDGEPRSLVDVGTAPPMIRRPLPLDGSPRTDAIGVEWRVATSARPDATGRTEYRRPGESEWTPRYVFNDVPRPPCYFAPANDFLQTAPESPFTGDPFVARATGEGHRTLSADTFTERTPEDTQERVVGEDEWHRLLAAVFGVSYR